MYFQSLEKILVNVFDQNESKKGRIRQLINAVAPFFIFAGVIYLATYKVLPEKGIIAYADVVYLWENSSFKFNSTWITLNGGIAWVAQIFGTFLLIPIKLTSFLLNFENGEGLQAYTLFALPMYLTCLVIFFIGKNISGNILYAYFAGAFILWNNYILEQILVWPATYFYCLLALCLLFYITWHIYQYGESVTKNILIVLCSPLAWHPFLWFLYLFYFFLFWIFFSWTKNKGRIVIAGFYTLGLIVLVNTYWVVPFLYQTATHTVSEIYSGSPEGGFGGYLKTASYNSFFHLLNYPFKMNTSIFNYIHNPLQTIFHFAFVALLGISFLAIKQKKPYYLFLWIIYLLFFQLALGPNAALTGEIWLWCFRNIPGFNSFRSFTRFLIISLLALIFIGSITVRDVRYKYKNILILGAILVMVFSNRIYFSGNFNGMVTAFKVPKEYHKINQKYFSDAPLYNILSLPHTAYESYEWVKNDAYKIYSQSGYFQHYFYSHPIFNPELHTPF